MRDALTDGATVTTTFPAPDHAPASPPSTGSRSALALAARQVEAVEAFVRAVRAAQETTDAPGASREMRMDSARRTEVLRRQHEAVVARAHAQLQATGELRPCTSATRVVLAHRSEWYLDRVTATLHDRGLEVVARLDNGADTVGLAVCEQPDVLLVEDTLAMVPGIEVVRELRQLCPQTHIVAQCAYSDRVGEFLEAGASAVYTRKVPPAEVAQAICRLVA